MIKLFYILDMNECAEAGMCPNGVCFNMDGSYKCRCNPGFKQSPNQQVCYGRCSYFYFKPQVDLNNL